VTTCRRTPPDGAAGGMEKINAAFAYGSRGLTGKAALSHGFELLAVTVRELTGITPDAHPTWVS
jgi:anionic cell wall polymer biosynthesis LytR-Cps2A-Psr (LCP) family protein